MSIWRIYRYTKTFAYKSTGVDLLLAQLPQVSLMDLSVTLFNKLRRDVTGETVKCAVNQMSDKFSVFSRMDEESDIALDVFKDLNRPEESKACVLQ